uniref:Butyrophilin subfamily 1 member A1-like n=1 Tax=Acanthochromis polyacanthus TaxID=80966 RepID=A0A3Q1HJK7_9TELE
MTCCDFCFFFTCVFVHLRSQRKMSVCRCCLGFWLFFLHSPPAVTATGQSELVCSPQPITALAGDDVTLPCRLERTTFASDDTLMWTKPDLDPKYIYVHKHGQLVFESQNPSYSYCTALFVDQLMNGNVSLKIFNVKLSDAGNYTCILHSVQKEALIQLRVGAVSTPVISLVAADSSSSSVALQCESAGWYPEPEVLWLDGDGNLLSKHSNNFTCRVQQKKINQSRETEIRISGDFFSAPSGLFVSITTGLAVGTVSVIIAFFAVWKLTCEGKYTLTSNDDVKAPLSDAGLQNLTNRITEEEREMAENKMKSWSLEATDKGMT